MKNNVAQCNHELIATFHHWFLFTQFKFIHEGDLVTGNTASFQDKHITIRYFIMMYDLTLVENGAYIDDEKFKDCVTSVNKLTIEDQAIAANKFMHFFCYIKESLVKHFSIWVSELLFLGLFLAIPA